VREKAMKLSIPVPTTAFFMPNAYSAESYAVLMDQ
jgi:hypothetical protein